MNTGGPFNPAHVAVHGEFPGAPAQFMPHPGASLVDHVALEAFKELLAIRGHMDVEDGEIPTPIEEDAGAVAEMSWIFAEAFMAERTKRRKGSTCPE